jgi:hypothetical protein
MNSGVAKVDTVLKRMYCFPSGPISIISLSFFFQEPPGSSLKR